MVPRPVSPSAAPVLAAVAAIVLGLACGGAPVERRALASAEYRRQAAFQTLQPVQLARCDLSRYGEPSDGGYLLCGNLLGDVQAAYSYGISGYDGWGCDVSLRLKVPVHQYDCFDIRRPSCAGGRTTFHEECIGPSTTVEEGRPFDTLQRHVTGNGDAGKRLLVKMDVEGAELDSLLSAPRALLEHIDQLAIEFHHTDDGRLVVALERLKEIFHVVHLHFNNFGCGEGIAPFPSSAYEVLFVHKRLSPVAADAPPRRPHPLDAPNDPSRADCQG
ncbi:MAG: hypothetical protein Q8L75_01470 [Acidobacteriota bacterium]|nr:hypothetical protein [Acidobacteriota bacterium]